MFFEAMDLYRTLDLKSNPMLDFSILVWFSKFRTVSPGCPPSQPHTSSAPLLFDEMFAQPDVFAVVNCTVVALSVFYSTVLMLSLIFLQLRTALT